MANAYWSLTEKLIAGDSIAVTELTRQALAQGTAAQTVLEEGLLPGMEVVGQRFKVGDMFIPEVLLSAKAMGSAMQLLRPLLAGAKVAGTGTVVIGTVQGDIHNIGKDLVGMMLEGAGFKVVDLGIDVKPEAFLAAVKEHKPAIVGMSAMLTTTMPRMKETVQLLSEAGIRDQLKVIAGGAPVTEAFIRAIGADAYGANATDAVEKAKALLKG